MATAVGPREAHDLCLAERTSAGGAYLGVELLRVPTEGFYTDLKAWLQTQGISNGQQIHTAGVFQPGADSRGFVQDSAQVSQASGLAGRWEWLGRGPIHHVHDPVVGLETELELGESTGKHCLRIIGTATGVDLNVTHCPTPGSPARTVVCMAPRFVMDVPARHFVQLPAVNTFAEASTACRQHNMQLADVDGVADLQFMFDRIEVSALKQAWLGGRRVQEPLSTLDFAWESGRPFSIGNLVQGNVSGDACLVLSEAAPYSGQVSMATCCSTQGRYPMCSFEPKSQDFIACPYGYLRWGGFCYGVNPLRVANVGFAPAVEACAQDGGAYPLTVHDTDELTWIFDNLIQPTFTAAPQVVSKFVLGRVYGKLDEGTPADGWYWVDGEDQQASVAMSFPGVPFSRGTNQDYAFLSHAGAGASQGELHWRPVGVTSAFWQGASTICKRPTFQAAKCSRGWSTVFGGCYAVMGPSIANAPNARRICHAQGGEIADTRSDLERRLLGPTLAGIQSVADGVPLRVGVYWDGGWRSAPRNVSMTVSIPGPTNLSSSVGAVLHPGFSRTLQLIQVPFEAPLSALCIRKEEFSCAEGAAPIQPTHPIAADQWVLHQESWSVAMFSRKSGLAGNPYFHLSLISQLHEDHSGDALRG